MCSLRWSHTKMGGDTRQHFVGKYTNHQSYNSKTTVSLHILPWQNHACQHLRVYITPLYSIWKIQESGIWSSVDCDGMFSSFRTFTVSCLPPPLSTPVCWVQIPRTTTIGEETFVTWFVYWCYMQEEKESLCLQWIVCEGTTGTLVFVCKNWSTRCQTFQFEFWESLICYTHAGSVFDNVWDINRDMLPKRPRHTVHTRIDVVILCCLIGHALLNRWLYCSQ